MLEMPPQDDNTPMELCYVVGRTTYAFAEILCRQPSDTVRLPCAGLSQAELRRLKRNLAQMLLEQDAFRPLLSVSAELVECLRGIAVALERMLDETYVQSFTDGIASSADLFRYETLRKFAIILGKPPLGFEAGMAIRSDAGGRLPKLLSLLDEWDAIMEVLLPEDTETAELHDNTKTRKHPRPPIAFQGSISVRTLAEHLHRTLHRHWPCQLNDHDHAGALGECIEADMQLDPQWITRGVQDGAFFVILRGAEISQECKINLSQTTTKFLPDDETLLCLLLYKECQDYCLYLAPDGAGQLWDNADEALDLQLHMQTDICSPAKYKLLSLKQLLQTLEPTYPAKRVVDMILARSLLLLLDGSWVGRSLSMENILIFCRIENDTPRPFFDKVFISTHFGSNLGSQPSQKQRLQHPFPAIQALGILMAEIELGDDLAGIYQQIRRNERIRTPGAVAKALLKECEKRLPLGAGVLRSIRYCIERTSFEQYIRRSRVGSIHDDSEFIENCYTNIVRPLEEDLVSGANWSWDEINGCKSRQLDDSGISKIITAPVTTPTTTTQRKRRELQPALPPLIEEHMIRQPEIYPQLQGHNLPERIFDAGTCVLAGADVSTSTDQWFTELEDVHKNLHSDRMEDLGEDEMEELIKVAVIDTGIDLTHEAFTKFIKNGQLDSGIDFVDIGKPIVDLDGHGTHVCHLLLKTAPYAKVYPMRVFRTNKREDTTPALVRKAIYHAMEEWGVDIISMSFAFEEEEPDIKDAVYNARSKTSKPVLMFAAASNNRALRTDPIGYPARVVDRVICVNSSTAQDEKSSFSPRGIPGRSNFSVIGENVQAAWPLRLNNNEPWKRISGTSCATPIVAGIAALILEFSKKDVPELRDLHKWNSRKDELWETFGMRSVLKKCMTAEHVDGIYNFLKPWQLLKADHQFIAIRIAEALESRYRWGV